MALTPDDVRKAALLLERRGEVKRAQDQGALDALWVLTMCPGGPDQFSTTTMRVKLPVTSAQARELLGAEYAALTARLRQLGVEPGE